jgi:urease subunit alpha
LSIVSRHTYASLYGPTAGDRFRLADTSLIAPVERSLVLPGEEAVYGGGKALHDGMGQVPGRRDADGVLDLEITSVIVIARRRRWRTTATSPTRTSSRWRPPRN